VNRLLVANRGEIARRVFATCTRLGIATAAVYAGPDADALFVRDADVAVALPGGPRAYLDGEAIIAAARRVDADAIHPGYGFLAENAVFARAVQDAGLLWIGPPPGVIEAMGSKTGARARMQAAGVSVLPGATDVADAHGVGFPLLVKASAGAAGRGCAWSSAPRTSTPRWRGRAAKPARPSATTRSSSSATRPARATSRSRSWATRTGASSPTASATAPFSAATRR